MTNKEIYRIWAPEGKRWVGWVRPVAFVDIDKMNIEYFSMNEDVAPAKYIEGELYNNAAIIVDLPGEDSVIEGIALAKMGYRPVPIFNGTLQQIHSRATSDNVSVVKALAVYARQLESIEIKDDALPAFLTDNNRLARYKLDISVFDNSWDVYHQDLPSANYFLEHNISKIIVIGNEVPRDLKKIFVEYQRMNIEIYWTNRYSEPQKLKKISKRCLKDKI